MKRNTLYLVICLLAAVAAIVSYMLYQEQNKGINIDIGEHGVSIDGK